MELERRKQDIIALEKELLKCREQLESKSRESYLTQSTAKLEQIKPENDSKLLEE